MDQSLRHFVHEQDNKRTRNGLLVPNQEKNQTRIGENLNQN